ncbi:putative rossmann-like alpha/beta/alpha sandwich protein [Helianthus debilis subsp. tardiflorus]
MEEKITGETSDGVGQQYTVEQPPLVAEGRRKKKLKVMVAVDESDASLYALKWTLEHLFKNPTAEQVGAVEPDPEQGMVTVVHVVQPLERYAFPAEASMYTSVAMVESVRKAQEQNAAQLLSRAFQLCKETKVLNYI